MGDKRMEQLYARLLASQEQNAAKNATEGRSFANMAAKGTPLNEAMAAPANTLSDVVNQIKQKGGMVETAAPRAEELSAPILGKLLGQGGFAKLMPMLGLGAAGLAAHDIYKKAKAGDTQGALGTTADIATDLNPATLIAKSIVNSPALGEGEDEQMAKIKQAQQQSTQPQLAEAPEMQKFAKLRALMGNK